MSALSEAWTTLVATAASRWATPFYLTAWEPIEAALKDLQGIRTESRLRHWLSIKTQPVRPLLRKWAEKGFGAEVVSEFEFRAALAEGFAPENILLNGVAKHAWLPRCAVPDLNVHIDSLTEASALAPLARALRWRVGLRLHVCQEFDPDEPHFGGHFGLSHSEAKAALDLLRASGVEPAGVHFHLRSNVESAAPFRDALSEVESFCASIGWRPSYIDTGGGLPDPGVAAIDSDYLPSLGRAVDRFASTTPTVREVWMEHGRFVTGRSAVLVVRVIDAKQRQECRYLICDGGRTNHALISDWETHPLFVLPERFGPPVLTTVSGPTCMAFDRLARLGLPEDVQANDLVVWMHAGAYHIPWETRFSRGLCRVIWCPSNTNLELIRAEETFDDWWNQWV